MEEDIKLKMHDRSVSKAVIYRPDAAKELVEVMNK